MGLTTAAEVSPESIVLTLRGTLDGSTAQVVGQAVAGIELDRPTILDLANLELADSAGLACLDELQRQAAAHGAATVAWGARPAIREVFERTGLARRISLM